MVENKPGASGNIAADYLPKSPPDGYMVMYTTITTHAINPSLFSKLPYDPVKDFTPVLRVGKTSLVLLELRAQMRDNASIPQGGTPEEFAAFLRSEAERWGAEVRRTGASAN